MDTQAWLRHWRSVCLNTIKALSADMETAHREKRWQDKSTYHKRHTIYSGALAELMDLQSEGRLGE